MENIIRAENLLQLQEKAWRDSTFKESLLNNPRLTLQQERINLSEAINLVVVAETDTHHFVVLPTKSSSVKTADTLLGYVQLKAMQNEEFKQELVANPKQVLSEELGQSISDEIEYSVLEETPNTKYLVIPPQPDIQYAIQRTGEDSVFKQKLLSEPKSTLAQIGMVFSPDRKIRVVEETDFQRYIILDEATEINENDPFISLKLKAGQDLSFKQQLKQNPKQTIEEELDFSLPSWVDLEVIEQTPDLLCLVIPYLPTEEEVEAEEMMAVTGAWRRRRSSSRTRWW